MGWLWFVGSIKLQVSFAKEPYKRDDILQKRPIILSILLTVATPYHGMATISAKWSGGKNQRVFPACCHNQSAGCHLQKFNRVENNL